MYNTQYHESKRLLQGVQDLQRESHCRCMGPSMPASMGNGGWQNNAPCISLPPGRTVQTMDMDCTTLNGRHTIT